MIGLASVFQFRLESGGAIGSGHLVRCRRLADVAVAKGYKVEFVLGAADHHGLASLEAAGVQVRQSADPYAIAAASLENVVVVVDAVHRRNLDNMDRFTRYLESLREHSQGLVFIDGGGSQAVRYRLARSSWDLGVAPYVGEIADDKTLAGARYSILGGEFERLPCRICHDNASNVLITFGGSDPHGSTADILGCLRAGWDFQLNIRIVVGANFSDAVRAKIRSTVARLPHRIEVIDSPQRLVDHMIWADVAIATSGLTKYELAACGVPAILVSLDEENWEINNVFLTEGTASDGGYPATFDGDRLAKDLQWLLLDVTARQTMADRGQALVDGLGRHRVFERMEQLLAI